MNELNTQAQIIELTDDQLELVEGGGAGRAIYEGIRFSSPAVRIGEWIAGGRYPWQ